MKKALVIIAFLFSFTTDSFSQSFLSMNDSSVFLISNDTLADGESIIYSGLIFNEGPQTYNSNILVASAVDTMGSQGADTANFNYLPWDNVAGGAVITMAPGDSAGFADTLFINNQFKSGINTVVIWPVANMPGFNSYSSKDSARFEVFVYDPLSIKNETLIDGLVLYPNPFSDKIWLVTKGKVSLEEVRIIDALGRTVYADKNPDQQFVETAHLQQGVYFIELSYSNGLKKRIKTMKQ